MPKDKSPSEITSRIQKIHSCFKSRNDLSDELYDKCWGKEDAVLNLEFDRLKCQWIIVETDLIRNVVDLRVDCQRYCRANSLGEERLSIVDRFRPYAMLRDVTTITEVLTLFVQEGETISPTDRPVGFITVLTREGKTYRREALIDAALRFWNLFLNDQLDLAESNSLGFFKEDEMPWRWERRKKPAYAVKNASFPLNVDAEPFGKI